MLRSLKEILDIVKETSAFLVAFLMTLLFILSIIGTDTAKKPLFTAFFVLQLFFLVIDVLLTIFFLQFLTADEFNLLKISKQYPRIFHKMYRAIDAEIAVIFLTLIYMMTDLATNNLLFFLYYIPSTITVMFFVESLYLFKISGMTYITKMHREKRRLVEEHV